MGCLSPGVHHTPRCSPAAAAALHEGPSPCKNTRALFTPWLADRGRHDGL